MAVKKGKFDLRLYQQIESRTQDMTVPLYTALVRSHLESCVEFWKLFCTKGIET